MSKNPNPAGQGGARRDENDVRTTSAAPLTPIPDSSKGPRARADDLARCLHWRQTGNGWRLHGAKRRAFGEVFPDSEHPAMWRTPLSGGRVSDLANLSWARAAVMDAAVREIEWEVRHPAQTDPPITRDSGAVFEPTGPVVRPFASGLGGSPPLAPEGDE